MQMKKITTSMILRVFFILLTVSIIGYNWQRLENTKTEIKAIGGHYSEGIIGAPRFINPVLAQSQADYDLSKLLFTPLLIIERNGPVSYRAAKSIEVSGDKLRYTLVLRDDIYFEDGERLTSEDVEFTITSIQDTLIKSPLAQQWEGVSIELIDSTTLEFILQQPFNDFLYNLELGILPKHIWENINPQEFIFSTYNTKPIGSGPYRVKKITTKENGAPSKYLLTRSENYYQKSYIENIEFNFYDNEKELIKALRTGTISGAYGLSPENIESSDKIYKGSLPRVFALFFNQNENEYLKSINIRKAIESALDKESLIDDVFSNFASPINSALGFAQEKSNYNPEDSIRLIESEGWVKNSDGYYSKSIDGNIQELEFSIATPNLEEMVSVANYIQQDLAAVGIRVNIRSYDQGNLNQNIIRSRDYESLLFGYEIKKPSDIYAFWHSSQISDPGLNISLLKNASLDQSLEKIRNESNSDFNKIDEKINAQVPAIFLYSPLYTYVLPKSVHNTELSITSSEDRFNNIDKWYIETRHVWNNFINKK
jgi:peptide/nickel transport system substrate-binding protein